MFIVFEGLDGSGSTTQAKLLVENLKGKGIAALHTCEPTGQEIGLLIRSALQKKWQTSPEALQMLFSADRADHLFREIEPALQAGVIVVSDRYFWSTIAYGALDCDIKWLQQLNANFRKPDHTFLLQVSTETCLERIQKRGMALEIFEQKEKLQKVWQIFAELAAVDADVTVIDGEESAKEITEEVWSVLQKKFPQKFYKNSIHQTTIKIYNQK